MGRHCAPDRMLRVHIWAACTPGMLGAWGSARRASLPEPADSSVRSTFAIVMAPPRFWHPVCARFARVHDA